jgi:hypothetical protein
MKFLFVVVCCFSAIRVQSQKLVLEFSGAPYTASISFFKKSGVIRQGNLDSKRFQPQYSLSVSSKIKGPFYVKTEIGHSVLHSLLNADIKSTDGIRRSFMGEEYAANIISLSILPEVRYSSKRVYGFVNVGAIAYSTVSNSIEYGVYPNGINESDFNGTSIGFVNNTGIGITVKGTGLYAGYGASYIFPHKNISHLPGLGYFQYYFRAGISYNIK